MTPSRLEPIERRVASIAGRATRLFPELELKTWSHSLGKTRWKDCWTIGIEAGGLEFPLALELVFKEASRKPRVHRADVVWTLRGGCLGRELSLEAKSLAGVERQLSCLERKFVKLVQLGGPEHRSWREMHPPEKASRQAHSEDRDLEIYRALERMGIGGQPADFGPTSWTPRYPASPELMRRYGAPVSFPGKPWADLVQKNSEELQLGEPGSEGWRGLRQLYARHPGSLGRLWVSRVGFEGNQAVVIVRIDDGDSYYDPDSILVLEHDGQAWRLRERFQAPWAPMNVKGELFRLEADLSGYPELASFEILEHDITRFPINKPGFLGRVRLRARLPDGTTRRFTVVTDTYLDMSPPPLLAPGEPIGIGSIILCDEEVVNTLKGILEHERSGRA